MTREATTGMRTAPRAFSPAVLPPVARHFSFARAGRAPVEFAPTARARNAARTFADAAVADRVARCSRRRSRANPDRACAAHFANAPVVCLTSARSRARRVADL